MNKIWLIAQTNGLRFEVDGSDLARAPMEEADIEEVCSLDKRSLGFSRADDHRWWMKEMRGFTYRRGREMVGYACLDGGWISPALSTDEETLVAIFADLSVVVEKDEVETAIFGGSRVLFQALLGAGFRIGPSKYSTVYASSHGPLPANYVLHSDWLP